MNDMRNLTSNSIIESLLGKVARLVWGVEDFIVEHGEVEGKTKANWVSWGKVGLSNLGSVLVGFEGLVGRLLSLVANGELSKVAVVVTLPEKGVSGCYSKLWPAHTSCGRTLWTLRTWRMESSACQGP